MRLRKWAVAALAAAIVTNPVLAAAPAFAIGSFNVKLTAAGCTEGDYYGQSARVSTNGIWGIRGTTRYTYPVCAVNTAGVRVFGPSSSSSWKYSLQSVTWTLTLGTNYPSSGAGWHTVNRDYLRTT
jgi:hypothetical protein